MKKHTSVFLLMLRAGLRPALLVLVPMVLAELVLVRVLSPETGLLRWTYVLAVFVLSGLLGSMGQKHGANPGLTIQRLSVSEQWTFVWQALSNLCWYLALWMVQVLLLFVMTAALSRPHALQLFYFQPFFHAMLPLQDWPLWLYDGLLLVTLSVSVAHFPYAQRRGKPIQEAILVLILFALSTNRAVFSLAASIVNLVLGLCLLAYGLYCVFGEEDVYEEA